MHLRHHLAQHRGQFLDLGSTHRHLFDRAIFGQVNQVCKSPLRREKLGIHVGQELSRAAERAGDALKFLRGGVRQCVGKTVTHIGQGCGQRVPELLEQPLQAPSSAFGALRLGHPEPLSQFLNRVYHALQGRSHAFIDALP